MRSIRFHFFVVATFALLMAVSFFSSSVTAQVQLDKANTINTILKNVTQPQLSLKGMSLLDPERFNSKNQYMMSFSSAGGNGSMVGMFINTMEYRFNCPLIMRVKVAYETQTGQLFGQNNAFTGMSNNQSGRLYIPSFDLIYQPFKNTTVSFHYRDYTSSYYQSMYGSRYGYGRYNRYGLFNRPRF